MNYLISIISNIKLFIFRRSKIDEAIPTLENNPSHINVDVLKYKLYIIFIPKCILFIIVELSLSN